MALINSIGAFFSLDFESHIQNSKMYLDRIPVSVGWTVSLCYSACASVFASRWAPERERETDRQTHTHTHTHRDCKCLCVFLRVCDLSVCMYLSQHVFMCHNCVYICNWIWECSSQCLSPSLFTMLCRSHVLEYVSISTQTTRVTELEQNWFYRVDCWHKNSSIQMDTSAFSVWLCEVLVPFTQSICIKGCFGLSIRKYFLPQRGTEQIFI